ncbi:hypothetical protein [Arthrobacter psychrolactophilus]
MNPRVHWCRFNAAVLLRHFIIDCSGSCAEPTKRLQSKDHNYPNDELFNGKVQLLPNAFAAASQTGATANADGSTLIRRQLLTKLVLGRRPT